jgi:hypothetical protein
MGTFTITQTPMSRFAYLYPDANGCHIGCCPFGDVYNYECVDDAVDSLNPDGTYVFMDGDSIVSDLYSVSDHEALTGTINYVKGCCRAKSDTYPPAHDFVYRIVLSEDSLCNDFASSHIMPLSTGFTTFEYAWSENPFTSTAWAWGDLDDLQIGFEASSPSVIISPIVFLPLYDGDKTEITNVTTGYEHWEAVRAERPLTEVSEVTDTWKYDLYDYIAADDSFFTASDEDNHVIMLDGVTIAASDDGTYLYQNYPPSELSSQPLFCIYRDHRTEHVDVVAKNGSYVYAGNSSNLYVYGISDAYEFSLEQTVSVDAHADLTIMDDYLITAGDDGINLYGISTEDGQVTLLDTDTPGANYKGMGVATYNSYIFASYWNLHGNHRLKAYTIIGGELNQVADLTIPGEIQATLAVDCNGIIFLPAWNTGIKAYSFSGSSFTLEDTYGSYNGWSVAHSGNSKYVHATLWTDAINQDRLATFTFEDGEIVCKAGWTIVGEGDTQLQRLSVYGNDLILYPHDNKPTRWYKFTGSGYERVYMMNTGNIPKGLDNNITSVSVVAKMGKEYDAPDEAEIYGRMVIKTHDTEYTSDAWQLDYPKKWYSYTWTTNPNTSAAWTLDEVKALQAGIGLKGDGSKFAACSICQLVISATSNVSPEIQTSKSYLKVNYTPPESTCTLNKPSEISFDHQRNVNILNFWSGNREVYDESRANKTLVLVGQEYELDPSFSSAPCERIQCIRSMGKDGSIVTPSGLGWGTGFIDGDYRIKSFGWKHISEKPEVYEWVLELEASE